MAAALTDVGLVRRGKVNEDSYCALELTSPRPLWLWAVADGVGGYEAGDVASRMAVEILSQSVRAAWENGGAPAVFLGQAIRTVNEAILAESERRQAEGMGTTLTAVVFDGEYLYVGHTGDTRAYLIRGGSIRQLTDDHSLVGELVRKGSLTESEAMQHPQRNVITHALGLEPEARVDVFKERAESGDRVVVCSDGLTGLVSAEEIMNTVLAGTDLNAAVSQLVAMSNERGGYDNITVVVADIGSLR